MKKSTRSKSISKISTYKKQQKHLKNRVDWLTAWQNKREEWLDWMDVNPAPKQFEFIKNAVNEV